MNPALLAAGIQGGKSLIGWLQKRRNKIPSFGGTEYGKYLKGVSEMGIISPTEQSNLISRSASLSGNVAANNRAGIRGYLESRRMGNSIASASALAQPELQLQRDIYGTSQDIELENERSKSLAEEGYARESYQNMLQRKGQSRADFGELISGVADAGTTGVLGYYQAKEAKKNIVISETIDRIQELIKNGRDEEAAKLWKILQGQSGGNI